MAKKMCARYCNPHYKKCRVCGSYKLKVKIKEDICDDCLYYISLEYEGVEE